MKSEVKRFVFVQILLIAISILSCVLLSKASLIGRTGINLFYKEYKFLKTWWKGAFTVFIVLTLFSFLQGAAQKKLEPKKAKAIHIGCLLAALAGLYFTYYDFRHTTTHRLLGERFHLGGYLFWIGWIIISVYYLTQSKQTSELASNASSEVS